MRVYCWHLEVANSAKQGGAMICSLQRHRMLCLGALSVLLVGSHSCAVEAQQGGRVPCDQLPIVLDQPGLVSECVVGEATAAQLAAAKKEFNKAGLPTDALDLALAPDAKTYMLNYHTPNSEADEEQRKLGAILLSVAHQDHKLSEVPLREFVTRYVGGSNVFSGQFDFDWRTHAIAGDYTTQQFIENASSPVLGTAMTWTCVPSSGMAIGPVGVSGVSLPEW